MSKCTQDILDIEETAHIKKNRCLKDWEEYNTVFEGC